jgi:hypothetical protein
LSGCKWLDPFLALLHLITVCLRHTYSSAASTMSPGGSIPLWLSEYYAIKRITAVRPLSLLSPIALLLVIVELILLPICPFYTLDICPFACCPVGNNARLYRKWMISLTNLRKNDRRKVPPRAMRPLRRTSQRGAAQLVEAVCRHLAHPPRRLLPASPPLARIQVLAHRRRRYQQQRRHSQRRI